MTPLLSTLLCFLAAGTLVTAQITAAYLDPITNILFQRFFGAKTTFSFGIALPQNPTTDFIGQILCPTPNNTGWGGITLADDMVGPLLLAIWPNGEDVMNSFRIAKTEDASPPTAVGNFSVTQIDPGTMTNGTHMMFTFLCQNCITGNSKLTFAASDTNGGTFEMGWALASTAVGNVNDPDTILPFHNTGFDKFDAQLSLARNANFGTWAAMAGVQSNGSTTPVPTAQAEAKNGDPDDSDDEDEDDD